MKLSVVNTGLNEVGPRSWTLENRSIDPDAFLGA
jgi:hypothetical protein